MTGPGLAGADMAGAREDWAREDWAREDWARCCSETLDRVRLANGGSTTRLAESCR